MVLHGHVVPMSQSHVPAALAHHGTVLQLPHWQTVCTRQSGNVPTTRSSRRPVREPHPAAAAKSNASAVSQLHSGAQRRPPLT